MEGILEPGFHPHPQEPARSSDLRWPQYLRAARGRSRRHCLLRHRSWPQCEATGFEFVTFDLRLERAKIAVVGLGYVGLPLAVALGREFPTLGFDVDASRIAELDAGHDSTDEVDATELKSATKLRLGADAALLKNLNVYIVAVPTPVTAHKLPDL